MGTADRSHIRTCQCCRALKLGLAKGVRTGAGARRLPPADLQGAVVLQDLEAIPGCAGRTHDLFLLVAHIAAALEDSAQKQQLSLGGSFPSLPAALHLNRPRSMCRQTARMSPCSRQDWLLGKVFSPGREGPLCPHRSASFTDEGLEGAPQTAQF